MTMKQILMSIAMMMALVSSIAPLRAATATPGCVSDDCIRTTITEILGAGSDPIIFITSRHPDGTSRDTDFVDVQFYILGKAGFLVAVPRVVPVIFAAFPNIDEIQIGATIRAHDIRGNPSESMFEKVIFTRANSESIHWDHIDWGNIPALADKFTASKDYYEAAQ